MNSATQKYVRTRNCLNLKKYWIECFVCFVSCMCSLFSALYSRTLYILHWRWPTYVREFDQPIDKIRWKRKLSTQLSWTVFAIFFFRFFIYSFIFVGAVFCRISLQKELLFARFDDSNFENHLMNPKDANRLYL